MKGIYLCKSVCRLLRQQDGGHVEVKITRLPNQLAAKANQHVENMIK